MFEIVMLTYRKMSSQFSRRHAICYICLGINLLFYSAITVRRDI